MAGIVDAAGDKELIGAGLRALLISVSCLIMLVCLAAASKNHVALLTNTLLGALVVVIAYMAFRSVVSI
jgi:hypothetical protein